jgi:hypothetical protein
MLFDGQKASWLSDNFALNTSRLATKRGRIASAAGKPFTAVYGHDPLIGLAVPGGYLWAAMFDKNNFPTATKRWDFWYSSDLENWTLIGYFNDYSVSTTMKLFDIYMSLDNKIIISASSGVASLVAGSVGGTMVCNLNNVFSGTYGALA